MSNESGGTEIFRFIAMGVVFVGIVFGVYACKQKQAKDVSACLATGKKVGECL